MKPRQILLGLLVAVPAVCSAVNIDRSTLTEVVNKVSVIEPATKKVSAAQVKTEFAAPNVLRTGPESRAEMVAPDQTVTRVGQNTIFSFSRDSRDIELQKGSILFQSPSGKGGGTIRTPAASAAVLGTTLIVVATKNGGFKVLLIEGTGRVKAADGTVRTINSGQMVYALPGGKLSGVFEFRLSQQVGASVLVSGFKKRLPSAEKILAAIDKQEKEIKSGAAIDTGLIASGSPSIAYKVDVARDALVQKINGTANANQRFINAATTDAIVDNANLDRARVFVPEDADTLGFPGDNRPFVTTLDTGFTERIDNAAQFIGQNILFDTPRLSLSPDADRKVVRFLSLQDIQFNQSIDFGVYPGVLQFWAGATFQSALGQPILVRAMAADVTFAAFGQGFSVDQPLPTSATDISLDTPLMLSGFTAENLGGSLNFVGGNVNLQGVRFGARGPVAVAALGQLDISGVGDGPTPPLLDGQPRTAFDNFSEVASNVSADLASGGNMNLSNIGVVAPQVRLRSAGDLKLTTVVLDDTSTQLAGGGGSSIPGNSAPVISNRNQVTLTAVNLANLRGVTFQSNDVLMQARTIRLEQVSFRQQSRVLLESQVGRLAPNPNTGQPAIPGFVNFVKGVTYGGSSAEEFVIQNGAGTTPSGPGIVIRPRGN